MRPAVRPAPRPDGKPGSWGYIACDGPTLFGTLADKDYLVRCWGAEYDTGEQFIQSVLLFALDTQTGRLRWTYRPERSIRNNAIAVSGGRVYLIDREVPKIDHVRFPIRPLQDEAKRQAKANGTDKGDTATAPGPAAAGRPAAGAGRPDRPGRLEDRRRHIRNAVGREREAHAAVDVLSAGPSGLVGRRAGRPHGRLPDP